MINDWRQGSWFDGDNNAALASTEAAHHLLRLSTSRTRAGKWLSQRQELSAPVTPVVHRAEAELFVELLPAHTDDNNFSVDFERLTMSYNTRVRQILHQHPQHVGVLRFKIPGFMQMFYDQLAKRLKIEMSMIPMQGAIRQYRRAFKQRNEEAEVPNAMPLPLLPAAEVQMPKTNRYIREPACWPGCQPACQVPGFISSSTSRLQRQAQISTLQILPGTQDKGKWTQAKRRKLLPKSTVSGCQATPAWRKELCQRCGYVHPKLLTAAGHAREPFL